MQRHRSTSVHHQQIHSTDILIVRVDAPDAAPEFGAIDQLPRLRSPMRKAARPVLRVAGVPLGRQHFERAVVAMFLVGAGGRDVPGPALPLSGPMADQRFLSVGGVCVPPFRSGSALYSLHPVPVTRP